MTAATHGAPMMAIEKPRNADVHRMFRRLTAIERFKRMLATGLQGVDRTEAELQRLRMYLDEWVRWSKRTQLERLGFPGESTFAPDQTSTRTATEYMERADQWAMQIVEAAVEVDLLARPDGSAMRAALRVRWLNEAAGARVFRHGRLEGLRAAEVDDLADLAELELVVIVRSKLPLS